MTDVAPVPEPTDVDTSALAETIAAPGTDTRDPLVLRQGKVTAVTPGVGEASVCSVSIGGAQAVDNVRHICEPPDVDDNVWLIQNGPDRLIIGVVGGSEKAGTIKWVGGTGGAPAGWWPCDGRSTSGYPKLAARYGANIPDLRDRFIVGAGSTHAAGATGGAATVTLTESQVPVPAHTHNIPNHQHTQTSHTHPGFDHNHATGLKASGSEATGYGLSASVTFQDRVRINTGGVGTSDSTGTDGAAYTTGSGGGGLTSNDGGGGATSSSGGGGTPTAHENEPPWYALLAIIRYG